MKQPIHSTCISSSRPSGFTLDEGYDVAYTYDMFGRFHSITSSVQSVSSLVQYNRLADSDLLSGRSLEIRNFLLAVGYSYEPARSLITSVENSYGETVISRYDYTNDEIGRRTSRADSGLAFAAQPTYGDPATVEMPAYNAYSYNTRSEVTGAARRWGTPDASGDLVLGQQYAYEFDSIGNRINAAEGDTSRSASYTANALNQYTQRTVPDEKDLIGTAPTNVAVTVNQNAASRQFAYWHHALEVTNAASAAYPQVAITAVYNPPGTNDPDVVTSQTGRVFVAKTPESFTYDHDGNLTQDGRFDYTWNGENRLIKAETRDDLPASVSRVKVEYAYDHKGRMVWKQISTNAVILSTRTLLWDGYNIVQALTHSQTHTLTNCYTWGLDLSGTLQGAGGVGGLLAEVQSGTPYFTTFDANGNVTEYLSADGTLAAHYEYSPFGEIVVQSGDLANSFTHRFSTKPLCPVTGLNEYLFRMYEPDMGRWMSRDPIGEEGGLNLYTFTLNAALNGSDSLGLMTEWAYDYLVGCNAALGQIGDYYYVDHGPMANRTHESGAGNAIFLTHWCKNRGKWQLCNTQTEGYLKVRVTECCELYNVRCQWVYSGESIIGVGGTPATSSANVGVGVWLTHGMVASRGATNGGKTRRIQSTWNGVLEGMMSLPRGSWQTVAGFSLNSIAQGGKEASIDEVFSLRCSVSCTE